jgi:hypothetical protein
VNKLVSSQLLFQLPQNSGARGKGNWLLKNGPAPIPRWLTDQLVLRHDQQKSVEIEI